MNRCHTVVQLAYQRSGPFFCASSRRGSRLTCTPCPKTLPFGSPQVLDSLSLACADCADNKQMIAGSSLTSQFEDTLGGFEAPTHWLQIRL
jgi:hypothetical protein